jgi:hypothetical protein
VKSDLDELIEYYEAEKNRVETLKKEALDDWDYTAADSFSTALRTVNVQLDILYKLKDPVYEKRKHLLRNKDFFENRFLDSAEKHDLMKTERYREAMLRMRDEELENIKSKLESIKDIKYSPTLDREEFDDAIYDLVDGKITAFKLHLKRTRSLYLNFERSVSGLMLISFPPDDPDEEYGSHCFDFIKIMHMGFYKNLEKRQYEFKYDLSSFRNSIFIKTIIARIIFDVFGGWELDNPAHIEISMR